MVDLRWVLILSRRPGAILTSMPTAEPWVEYIRRREFRRGSFESPIGLLANGETRGPVLFASFLVFGV